MFEEGIGKGGNGEEEQEEAANAKSRFASFFLRFNRRSLRKCRASIHFGDFAIIIWLFGFL